MLYALDEALMRAAADEAVKAIVLAHAHNQLIGDWLGGVRADAIKAR